MSHGTATVWYLFQVSRVWFTVVFNSYVVFPCLIMILSWPWISISCLSRSVIRLSWPSFCSLLTFLRLYDALIVSRMISWLYFLMSFLLSCWWSCTFLHIPFTAYRRFIIRANVDDNILEISGLLIALFTIDMLCWIIALMVLLWCLCCLVLVVSWCWPFYQCVNSCL